MEVEHGSAELLPSEIIIRRFTLKLAVYQTLLRWELWHALPAESGYFPW